MKVLICKSLSPWSWWVVLTMLFTSGCRGASPGAIQTVAPAATPLQVVGGDQFSTRGPTVGTATPTALPKVAPTLTPGVNGAIQSMVLITRTASSEYYALTYWSDGLRVTGFLGCPRDDGRHPAIIYNRGGDREFGALTGWEIVPFVEAGYVTAASQYRGNAGSEGKEEFGGADVNDVLNLVPLLDQLPYVDPERIGMMGYSRGGMMTYLALKQETLAGTHHIKAAATVGGVADLFMLVEGQPGFISMVGARPEDDPALYQARSATYWPELFNAPLLIQHGESDELVSVEQSRRLAQALKAAGKTVPLITYPGEDHSLSKHSGGMPEALTWFQKYLGRPGEDHSFDSHAHTMGDVINWFQTFYKSQ